jgi:phage tail-like protein
MAIYGRDYYGRAKYGGRQLLEMAVDPFTAEPSGFDTALLRWTEPGGNWSGFRLVRSASGFPITENDGTVVIEYPIGYTGATGGQYADTGLQGGWQYYAIFLYDTDAGNWDRAAAVDVMLPFDFKSTDKIWNTIPEYYREIRDTGAGYSQVKYRINPAIYRDNADVVANEQLIKFLHIFGWGVDMLRSQVDSVMDGYNVSNVHVNRLALLAAQFGSSVESAASASVNRSMVRNLGWLYRKRGTVDGLRELLSLVTGWDVDVSIGPNLMLSEDQAAFAHPDPQFWDSTVRYVVGDRVKYGLYLFQAKQVAYGINQGPPISFSNNDYWERDRFVEPQEDRTVNRVDTGDVSTWQLLGPSGIIPAGTFIGAGSQDAEDSTIRWSNCLAFWNTGAAAADLTLRSIPRPLTNLAAWDKQLVIESGIPVPWVWRPWVAGTRYRGGDMVMYRGSPYEALGTTEEAPTVATSWKRLGYDDRVRLCLSFYAHGPGSGTIGSGGRVNYPHVMQFNENGDLLTENTLDPTTFASSFFDPFNVSGTLTSGRLPAKGAAWTANGVGTWGQSRDDIGGYVYPPVGRSIQVAPATDATVNVAASYRTVGSRLIGVMFRWTDSANYWIATQTGLFKVVAGVITNPASGALAYPTCAPGDRLRVALNGNTITVYKNGVSMGSATDSFNATSTRHGVGVEA